MQSYQVLLAEDEQALEQSVRPCIEQCSEALTVCRTIALSGIYLHVRSHPFDVLLLSVKLLRTADASEIKHIRTIAPQLPILLLTDVAHLGLAIAGLQQGGHSYLVYETLTQDLFDGVLRETIRCALSGRFKDVPSLPVLPQRRLSPIAALPQPSQTPPPTTIKNTDESLEPDNPGQAVLAWAEMIDAVPGVVYQYTWLPSGELQWMFLSRGCDRLLGVSMATMQADPHLFWDMVDPSDCEALRQTMEQARRSASSWTAEFRIQLPDGSCRWLQGRSNVSRCPDGTTMWAGVLWDVSDRKTVDAALADSEATKRALVEGIPDLLMRMTGDGIYLACNRADINPLRSPGLLQPGRSIFDALPRAIATERIRYARKALRTQTPQFHEYEIPIKGRLHHEEARIIPINQTDVLVIIRDITQRKQTELDLRRQRLFLEQILDSLKDCLVFVKDVEGRFLAANQAVADRYGIPLTRLIGQRETDVYPCNPVEFEHHLNLNSRVMRTGEIYHISEECLEHYDGSEHWYQTTVLPFCDEQKQVIGVVGISVDISERRQLEHRLQQKILQQQLTHTITNTIRQSLDADVIFQTSVNLLGQTFAVNHCILSVVDGQGMPMGAAIASPLPPQVEDVAEYYSDRHHGMLSTKLKAEQPIRTEAYLNYVLKQDKAIAIANIYTDPTLNDQLEQYHHYGVKSVLEIRTSYQGKPNGVIGLYQCDAYRSWNACEIHILETIAVQIGVAIAHAQLLQQALRQRQELQQKNCDLELARSLAEAASHAKSEFLSHMSHELKTPLNIILGYVQLMLSDSTVQHHADSLNSIFQSGNHLLFLINNILDLSKLESGTLHPRMTELDLFEFLSSLQQMFQIQASQKALQLQFEVAANVPQWVETDANRLRQILINLLGNALKFTAQGMVALRVSCQPMPQSTTTYHLCFEVMDTGIGIAPEDQAVIFEPFVQASAQSSPSQLVATGTGLGLSIVKELVTLLGGSISLESAIAQGSTFTVWLPVEVSLPLADTTLQLPLHLLRSAAQHRVLVLDVQRDARHQLAKLLMSVGCEVHEVASWQEAIAHGWDHAPHLLLVNPRYADDSSMTLIAEDTDLSFRRIALLDDSFSAQQRAEFAQQYDAVLTYPIKEHQLLDILLQLPYAAPLYSPLPPAAIAPVHILPMLPIPDPSRLMPPQWMQDLLEATLRCDDKAMMELVQQVPPAHEALHNALVYHIENFSFEPIVEILSQSLSVLLD